MRKNLMKRITSFAVATAVCLSAFVVPAAADVTLNKDLTLYLIPNTHLDTAWQHPFPQVANDPSMGIRAMYRNSTSALSQGDYRFTTSASAHLKMLKDYYNDDNPDANRYWALTRQLVDEGKMDLAGGQVVEPDLNIPSGEALVRQSLYAQHFFSENFTRDGEPYVAKAGMVPDVFGFSGQLPQILKKSEMKYFVTSKVNWNGNGDGGGTAIGSTYENWRPKAQRDADIQYWQALDGESRVLSYFLQNDYNNTNP
ncbi:MAG: hypothetical protein LBU77_03280, partial [Clostridiales bacterium]|nr:hypothetical protein [Clostridiales bacterium]